jgi:CheY-like chemotaxis protein
VLRALLATSSVLFLGYSLKDAYLNELRAELVEALQGGEGRGGDGGAARPLAWAVLEDISDVARAYYEKHEGLGVLAYRTADEGRDHSGFDRLLAQIYAETNPIHRLGQLLKGRRLMWLDPSPANNELGRRLLTEAVRDVEETNTGLGNDVLVDVADLAEAVQRFDETPPFDLIISHWGHGLGPDGCSNGEALLRAAAVRRARGEGAAPIVIFGGPEFARQNRRRALSLGAFAFTSEWQALMGAIERVLGDAGPAA